MKNGQTEVLEAETKIVDGATALESITSGEINGQVTTARRYPRSITQFRKAAIEMATLDEPTALSCLYALPRGNKTIEGPSARLAEILQVAYHNLRTGGRVIGIDREFVTVQAVAWDMEANSAVSTDVKRRITDKQGRRFNDDMIGVTSNAAIAIGIRNATLKIIPQALWRPVYDAAKKTAVGDATTLSKRRKEMLDYFMKAGVRNEQVFAVLEVKGEEEITLDHLVTMRATAESIKSGELTIDGVFNADAPGSQQGDVVEEYLSHVQDDALATDIRKLLDALKLNKGQVAARMKQHEGNPTALVAELRKALEARGAGSTPDKPTDKPADKPAAEKPATNGKSNGAPAAKVASPADDEF